MVAVVVSSNQHWMNHAVQPLYDTATETMRGITMEDEKLNGAAELPEEQAEEAATLPTRSGKRISS